MPGGMPPVSVVSSVAPPGEGFPLNSMRGPRRCSRLHARRLFSLGELGITIFPSLTLHGVTSRPLACLERADEALAQTARHFKSWRFSHLSPSPRVTSSNRPASSSLLRGAAAHAESGRPRAQRMAVVCALGPPALLVKPPRLPPLWVLTRAPESLAQIRQRHRHGHPVGCSHPPPG